MRITLALALAAASALVAAASRPAVAVQQGGLAVREVMVPAGNAPLYARDTGRGQPIIVLHGGPDFDHTYLLPDLDRLADGYRLLYYDQRGRGRSAEGVRAEDVSLASDIADVDRVREFFQLPAATIFGHSWGTTLALEYALRFPDRVSRLILMNPAPASAADFHEFRRQRLEKMGPDLNRLKAIAATPAYKAGEPDAVVEYYRVHFRAGLKRPQDYEALMQQMRPSFSSSQANLKARQIEDRLMADSWLAKGYDLLPKLGALKVPTLIIAGDADFIPGFVAARIAAALPRDRVVTIKDCGHFAYLECPGPVRKEIDRFFGGVR
jgi:proline iminopeptidase